MSKHCFPEWVEKMYAETHMPTVYEAPDEEDDFESILEKVDILLGDETVEEMFSL